MCNVLIVDDDPIVRMAHERMLQDDYSVSSLSNGQEALDYFKKHSPDVVLLDVGLPDIDGFDVCRQLQNQGVLESTSVIFVSASTDLDSRIKAFDSGGDDFIGKPMQPEELLSKVNVLHERKRSQSQIHSQLFQAQQTVMTALSTSSEIGRVMQFVENSFSLNNIETLVNAAVDVLQFFNLSAVFAIEYQNETHYFTTSGNIKPIEQELIELLKNKGRFYDFNSRTQVNFSHVSLLVKNMPSQEDERYGRIKDLLPALLGCLNARVGEIDNQQNILSQTQTLIHSFDVIQYTMKSLTNSLGNNQKDASERLHKMVYELQVFIQKLGLEEDQEERVIKYVDDAVEESLRLLDSGDVIFKSFESILTSLEDTIRKQNEMVNRTILDRNDDLPRQDVADNSGIDLF